MTLILQLIAAHIIAEFLFMLLGPEKVLESRWTGSAGLVGYEFLAGILMINRGLSQGVLVTLLCVSFLQGVIHYIARWKDGTWLALLIAEAVHLSIAWSAGTLLTSSAWTEETRRLTGTLDSPLTYLYIAVYVGVVFGGKAVVQKITEKFLHDIDDELLKKKPGLPKAGAFIGWVERFLVLTFVVVGANEAIGFLLAVKALVRFPEIKDDEKGVFGEYFLVGTFASMSLALMGGLLLKLATTHL